MYYVERFSQESRAWSPLCDTDGTPLTFAKATLADRYIRATPIFGPLRAVRVALPKAQAEPDKLVAPPASEAEAKADSPAW